MSEQRPERRQSDNAVLSALDRIDARLEGNNAAMTELSQSIESLGRVTAHAAQTAANAAHQSSETAEFVTLAADHADGDRERLQRDLDAAKREALEAAAKAREVALAENAATRLALVRRGALAIIALALGVVVGGLLLVHAGTAADRRQNVQAAQLLQQRNQTARISCESRNAAAVASGEKLDAFFLGLEAIERRNTTNEELAAERIRVYEKARRDFGQAAPMPNCAALYPNTHP